jgi:hypothetical protein
VPRPPINLHLKVRQVLQHTSALHPEADRPIRHFERSTISALRMMDYLVDHIDLADVYPAVFNGHLAQLRRMILAELIESFERFLKELAAVCIDYLASYTADDRFDDFVPKRGGTVAAFVSAASVGKALCESDTWISNSSINARFACVLKAPFGADWELLFPQPNQRPESERARAATLAILWQIRHNLAHNIGVLTHSDAMKFRLLVGGAVAAERRLGPTADDLKYVKRFLKETADHTNQRVGQRLAELLGLIHAADPGLFDGQAKANEVSQRFTFAVTINGHVGVL